jgi:hypothetical protein
MRALILLGLALPAAAAAAPYAYTLTGDQFVSMMNVRHPMSDVENLNREKAYSYLDGVRDTAEGRVWCDVHEAKTHDLAAEAAAKIAKLPASERRKSASALLLDQLKREYPCPKSGGAS